MGDPELRNDEQVLVRTPGVYVKSIPFEGILTNKRVILIDRAKNLLPPKEIPLTTIQEVGAGENAIRDQILTLSVLSKTGETRQMILTFSRQEGGNRIKERDEWARVIRQNMSSPLDTVFRKVIPGTNVASRRTEPSASPRITIVNSSHPVPDQDIPAPVRNDTGSFRSPPVPGQHVFCSRCGNKVPLDSAFCNRCGSPIVVPGQFPPAAVQQVPPAPVITPPHRPIDREIQAVEPLIERSSVKVPSDPLRIIPDIPVRQSPAAADSFPQEPAATLTDAPPSAPAEKPPRKGFLPRLFSPKARSQAPKESASPRSAPVPPMPGKPRRSLVPGKRTFFALGGIVVVILLVVVGAVFIYPMLTSGAGLSLSPETTAAPTPAPATTPASGSVKPTGTFVVVETPAPQIPPTGVQVHVNYIGGFKGTYGIPDALVSIPGNSGDRVWEVENVTSTVQARFEKLDGSSHELLVEIYKNGAMLTRGSTTIGHGSVLLSVDTKTGIAAAPVTSGGGAAKTTATTAVKTTVPAGNSTKST